MNHTPNYSLPSWETADRIQMADFNDMTAKIDTALADGADALAAEQTARQSADAALSAQVVKLGNCRIYHTSYKGTSRYGQENPTSITFPGKPLLVAAGQPDSLRSFCIVRGADRALFHGMNDYTNYFTWSGNTLSWYCEKSAEAQMNTGATHYVVALIAMDDTDA